MEDALAHLLDGITEVRTPQPLGSTEVSAGMISGATPRWPRSSTIRSSAPGTSDTVRWAWAGETIEIFNCDDGDGPKSR